jgi:hypothetical protein
MINRTLIVAAVVLLIVSHGGWGGGCMSIQDGALWNDCGLWQWWAGRGLYISLNDFGIEAPESPIPMQEDYTPPPVIIPPPPTIFKHHDNAPSVMSSVTMTMGEPEYTPRQLPQMSMQFTSGTMAMVTATMGMTYGSAYVVSPPPVPQNVCATTSGTAVTLPPGSSTTTGAQYFIQNTGSGQVCIITNGAGQ